MKNGEENKVKIIILLATKAVAKATSLLLPTALEQLLAQEAIDAFYEKVLQTSTTFPSIEHELSNYSENVRCAVNDILLGTDISSNLSATFNDSETNISEFMYHQFTSKFCVKQYDESEQQEICNALSFYLTKIRAWSVRNADTLSNLFNSIYSTLRQVQSDLDKIKATQVQHSKQLRDIDRKFHDIKATTTGIKGVKLCNYRQKAGNTFYNYFFADSKWKIQDFFLFDNYRKCVFSDAYTPNGEQVKTLSEFTSGNEVAEIENIVKNQGILLVTGLYGTGKTSLLKKLFYTLEQRKKAAYFFKSSSIIEYIDSIIHIRNQPFTKDNIENALPILAKEFESYTVGHESITIFIDELEELNIACEGNSSYLEIFINWLCDFQRNEPKIFFILASRKYLQIGENEVKCIFDVLFLEYYCHNEGKCMTIIQTEKFSSEARGKWIEAYSFFQGQYIVPSEVGKSHKKIFGALANPIFLFAFMKTYLNELSHHKLSGYYYYYSSFIRETVSGRYGLGEKSQTLLSENEYYKILREIAFTILSSQSQVVSTKIYKDNIHEEQPVLADDLTSRKFEIPLSKLSEVIPVEDYQKASFLNCYFFNMDRHRVYFTDTNILFALAAEYIFYSLKDVIDDSPIFSIQHLDKIVLAQFYPQLIDYVIYLVENSSSNPEIFTYLDSFVKNDTIQSHNIDLSNSNNNRVERIILLYILFFKLCTHSYKEYPGIFKTFFYYVDSYKINLSNTVYKASPKESHEEEKIYTVERYFMNIHLFDPKLEQINFTDCNFQNSKIRGSKNDSSSDFKIVQCNFTRASFNEVTMAYVRFELCEFNDVKVFNLHINREFGDSDFFQSEFIVCRIRNSKFIGSSLIFKNCTITGLEITLNGIKNLTFDHCIIQNLHIRTIGNKTYKPSFSKCIYLDTPRIDHFTTEAIKNTAGLNG